MKILMLSWEYPPFNVGGLGKHVMELVPALTGLDVEVHLLTPRWPDGQIEEIVALDEAVASLGLPLVVHRVPAPEARLPGFFSGVVRANQLLERYGAELITQHGDISLIHVHDWLVSFAGIALKHAFKLPLLATIHATEYGRHRGNLNGDLPRAIHQAEWQLSYEAWRIITCSQFMANEVQTAFQAPPDKIDVVANGIDTTRFDQYDGFDLTAFRSAYAAPDEPLIFNVGRIVYEKGVHVLVEAMPRILSEVPDARLVVAGTGGYLEPTRQLAVDLGVIDRVAFLGFIADEDRDRLFRTCDVAVFPSLYEPFGIVALEAMAARAPVVVTQAGGLAEVVMHAKTGIVVQPDNVDELAWGVLHTLQHPELTRARVDRAHEVVRQEYNWQRIARRTREIYDRVVAERRVTVW